MLNVSSSDSDIEMFQHFCESDKDNMSVNEYDIVNENGEPTLEIPVRVPLGAKMSRLGKEIEIEALEMIINLWSRGNVPFKVSIDILKYVSNIVKSLVKTITEVLVDESKDLEHTEGVISKINNFIEAIEELNTINPAVGTEYKIRKFYENHPLFC